MSIGDNFYAPESVTINAGDTVTWNNDGAAQHSATADDGSFDTGVFNGGQSRSETFTTAGTISYFCTVHGQAQSGTIKVLSSGGGGGGGSGGSSSRHERGRRGRSPDAAGSSLEPAGDRLRGRHASPRSAWRCWEAAPRCAAVSGAREARPQAPRPFLLPLGRATKRPRVGFSGESTEEERMAEA